MSRLVSLRLQSLRLILDTGDKMVDELLASRISSLLPDGGFKIQGLADNSAYQNLSALIQSVGASDAEECGRVVGTLTTLSRQQDLPTQIVLRLLAESVEWPPYMRGDGYWAEPSKNASELVLIGWNLSADDVDFARDVVEAGISGVGFIALGLAKNQQLPRELILSLKEFDDPVIAVASEHPSLVAEDVRDLLQQVENFAWISALVSGQDGWTWPDWQQAFGLVSTGCPDSKAFWEVLLSEIAKSPRWPWIEDFVEDFEDYDGGPEELEGLVATLKEHPELMGIAFSGGWVPALVALATVANDADILKNLAVSDEVAVREAVIANEYADDEIRALAVNTN